jgi:hypothetical protein
MVCALENAIHNSVANLTVAGLLAFTKMLGMDSKEADQICRDATAATKNKSLHAYFPQ